MSPEAKFSVIVPVFNEEATIGTCLEALRRVSGEAQIIVVDGESTDKTVEAARRAGVTVVTSRRGRGIQCNNGVRIAAGDIYVFLHADTRLPEGAFVTLRRAFADRRVQVAKFRLRFDRASIALNVASFFTRFDGILTSFGDQGIAVRSDFFKTLGGFPDWPLFEDVHFFRLARHKTCIVSLPDAVTTSSRRFQKQGVLVRMIKNFFLIVGYLCGVPAQRLARRYEAGEVR